MKQKTYLAIDLGAGSGRVMAVHYDGKRLQLEEIHRFLNPPIELPTGPLDGAGTRPVGLFWGLPGLYHEAQAGLQSALRAYPQQVVSIGVDTWGVDYGHFSACGQLLGLPRVYRDTRTEPAIDHVYQQLGKDALYSRTGLQPFNTLHQLYSEVLADSPILAASQGLLLMPDIFNYWLSGARVVERTNASTTQLYDVTKQCWDWTSIRDLGLPERLFGELVSAGTHLGSAQINSHQVPVVAVGSHDTASAVAAVPLSHPDAAYLSSGTWSLLGQELAQPILTEASRQANFTNEVGVEGTIRYLKNICGLWLVQECKRHWQTTCDQPLEHGQLVTEAERAPAFAGQIDPDDPCFTAPGDMPARITRALEATGQKAPEDRGSLCRIIFESLALKCRLNFDKLASLTGKRPPALHVVGGGSRNALLNQMLANALGIPVHAGPVEATALGNVLMQLKADGQIASLAEGRALVATSSLITTFEPQASEAWQQAMGQYAGRFGSA